MPDSFKLLCLHAKNPCPATGAARLFCPALLLSRLHHRHPQRRVRLSTAVVAVAIILLFCGAAYSFTTTTVKTDFRSEMLQHGFLNTRQQPASFCVKNFIRRSASASNVLCWMSSSSSSSSSTTPPPPPPRSSTQDKRAARARRKRKIGLAKAVDHAGLENRYRHTYRPGPPFVARTGLPPQLTTTTTSSNNNNNIPHSSCFTVLGIETSCDDTGAAVVRSDGALLGEALASQAELHEPWGGIVPNLAMQAHQQAVDVVVRQALRQANVTTMHEIDAVAVTVGPGLEICLRVGVEAAVQLSQQFRKPFVAVHHLEAHILMARLPPQPQQQKEEQLQEDNQIIQQQQQPPSDRAIEFPFLALLVSGGHCQLLRCHGIGRYDILGGTLDDSLGEAFDKTARLLGLPVGGGGGPAVERLARRGNPRAVPLTVPMRNRHDCDFSYAGLKSNVRRAAEQLVQRHNTEQQQQQQRSVDDDDNHDDDDECRRIIETPDQLPESIKADLAASFQNVAIAHIEDRLKRAIRMVSNDDDENENTSTINTLALVGGVAANQELRSRLETVCRDRNWTMVVPPPRLCTDQGAMSAWAGVERLLVGSSDDRSTDVYARYPFASLERELTGNNENKADS